MEPSEAIDQLLQLVVRKGIFPGFGKTRNAIVRAVLEVFPNENIVFDEKRNRHVWRGDSKND